MSSMHLPSAHTSISVFIIYFCRPFENRAKIITLAMMETRRALNELFALNRHPFSNIF